MSSVYRKKDNFGFEYEMIVDNYKNEVIIKDFIEKTEDVYRLGSDEKLKKFIKDKINEGYKLQEKNDFEYN